MKRRQIKIRPAMWIDVHHSRGAELTTTGRWIGGIPVARWVRQAIEAYFAAPAWELPLCPLRRGEAWRRVEVALDASMVAELQRCAKGHRVGVNPHALAGFIRRIMAWRLARERQVGHRLAAAGNGADRRKT